MGTLEALKMLAARTDRSAMPYTATAEDGEDFWPHFAAAAAELSGRLAGARTDGDLDALIERFWEMADAGFFTGDDLDAAVERLIEEEEGREAEAFAAAAAWN